MPEVAEAVMTVTRTTSRLSRGLAEIVAYVNAPAQTKSIMVVKTAGEPLGFTIRYNTEALVVTSVLTGSTIERWNERNPNHQIVRGTRIRSINGERRLRSMLSELHRATVASALVLEVFREVDEELVETLAASVKKPEVLPLDCLHALVTRPATCEDDDCAICLGALEPGENVVQLPCRHAYHKECITQWLTKCSKCCPLCMQAVSPCHSQGESTCPSSDEGMPRQESEDDIWEEHDHEPIPIERRLRSRTRCARPRCISL
mmetsp:Transcript_36468/g.67906  ORF Transcript_36468/g.67906 Transcript_36468/m.67906 type:complete len:261 (-) Transcript_36468:100-882(-)